MQPQDLEENVEFNEAPIDSLKYDVKQKASPITDFFIRMKWANDEKKAKRIMIQLAVLFFILSLIIILRKHFF